MGRKNTTRSRKLVRVSSKQAEGCIIDLHINLHSSQYQVSDVVLGFSLGLRTPPSMKTTSRPSAQCPGCSPSHCVQKKLIGLHPAMNSVMKARAYATNMTLIVQQIRWNVGAISFGKMRRYSRIIEILVMEIVAWYMNAV
jgi:hypothetical protein